VLYTSQDYLKTRMRDLDHSILAGAENSDRSRVVSGTCIEHTSPSAPT
jgi:hypothetical protein